jgi:hypothetical protein
MLNPTLTRVPPPSRWETIVMVYFAVNAVKQTGSQDMNITSLVELCTILVGFIAEHGLAGCMILINDPYHLIVIGK